MAENHALDVVDQDDLDTLEALEALGEEQGYFESLGPRHAAVFAEDGPVLIVTFESLAAIRARPGHRPLGLDIAEAKGWSCLCLIAVRDGWYRDPAVYGFFDRQADDAFFEDFDRVVFWGAGRGGYAAGAFSVTAPGATVVMAAPQATLDPRVAGWDERFRGERRQAFTDRYGFAPEMVEGAGPVFVIFDPREREDAMHAALFARNFTTLLPCRGIGPDPAAALAEMEILGPVLVAAGEGRLDAALFWRLYRARRRYMPYLRRLGQKLETDKRMRLVGLLYRAAFRTTGSRRFRRWSQQIAEDLADQGQPLPEVPEPVARPEVAAVEDAGGSRQAG